MNDRHPTTNNRSKTEIKKYVEDGYNVTEITFSDGTYMITKERGNEVFYCMNGNGYITRGKYDKREFDRRMEAFDESMKEWSKQCDEWGKKLTENVDKAFSDITIPPFPDFPNVFESENFISKSIFPDSLFEFEDSSNYTDTNVHAHRNVRKSQQNQSYSSSGGTGCLGCLFWSLVILCIICIVFYGMGVIGGNIIHFIGEFFKSLF